MPRISIPSKVIPSRHYSHAIDFKAKVPPYLTKNASLASPGIDELRWLVPVRPGDILRMRVTVAEARRSKSKPDRGLVRSAIEVLNQKGEIVMTMMAMNLINCRNRQFATGRGLYEPSTVPVSYTG